jgi:hypothetical protein
VKTEKDYEEFLELLNKHNVRYCVIGAFALAFHARPRYTKDLDILIEPKTDNAKKLLIALKGLEFADIWKSRIQGPYGKQTVNFIDRQNLIRSKSLSNRAQDKVDLKLLMSDE